MDREAFMVEAAMVAFTVVATAAVDTKSKGF